MTSKSLAPVTLIVLGMMFSNHCSAQCDGSLWKFVYHPQRFTIWNQCKTVTGTVMLRRKEKDGDYHLELELDPGQTGFQNQRNMTAQHGCLVLEIICRGTLTQPDAIQPCHNCPKTLSVPKVGDHIKISGTFVRDLEENHGWNEIHPAFAVDVTH
jgi:hypothetical protein